MSKRLVQIVLLYLCIFQCINSVYGQSIDSLRAQFFVIESQRFGFDSETETERDQHEIIEISAGTYIVPFKSIGESEVDTVGMRLSLSSNYIRRNLSFKLSDSLFEPEMISTGKDSFKLVLPSMSHSYDLSVFCRDSLIGKLNVSVYPKQQESLIIVPLLKMDIDADSLQSSINNVFIQANLEFSVSVASVFESKDFESGLLRNPSPAHDRYREQMTMIRNAYFKKHPPKGAYYLFVVEGFVDTLLQGYMVQNKGVGFVKYSEDSLYPTIIRQLGFGAGALHDTWLDDGPARGSTHNLMDVSGGHHLTASQWRLIQLNCHSVSYYDGYEDVKTNNGLIAFYLWEEDENGDLIFLSGDVLDGIDRPFKRNQYSLHLEINNWLYQPLFGAGPYKICGLHFLVLIILFIGAVYLRRLLVLWITRFIGSFWLFRLVIRAIVFTGVIAAYIGCFGIINSGYALFEVESGRLKYLHGMDTGNARITVGDNINTNLLREQQMGSEILVKRGQDWFLEKRKKVLYFNVIKEGGNWSRCVFKEDSDTLTITTKDYSADAESHYLVFNYLREDGACAYQKVYNHLGKEITDKLELKDPAKRILLFVNGYRPTSLGETFEENFADIRKNGLEFPNSKNLIYNFDRYDYWRPWKEIDSLFAERLNPGETLYADGHFSVATSNHRSLLGFTKLSATYPKRCKNDRHVCMNTEVSNWWYFGMKTPIRTVELHNLSPNKQGFNFRRTNGKVAGTNLLQMLNELPNKSENDTLFIVAHSMGYAYSLGIIDQLRGKINFGGFYIIAPENASAGKLNMSEWEEVWQYGSDFDRHKHAAPCLLDGIAPQVTVGGLNVSHQLFIPEKLYTKMGFFDSHFIGNYTWVFDIEKSAPGYIRQR